MLPPPGTIGCSRGLHEMWRGDVLEAAAPSPSTPRASSRISAHAKRVSLGIIEPKPDLAAALVGLQVEVRPVPLHIETFTYFNRLAARGELPVGALSWDPRTAVCVVLASEGYPESSSEGDEIVGLDEVLADYVAANSPLAPAIQGRIVCTTSGATPCPVITAP